MGPFSEKGPVTSSEVRECRQRQNAIGKREFSEKCEHEIFATWIMMFVVLIPFFFTRGVIEMLGKDEAKRLLVNAVPKSGPLPAKNSELARRVVLNARSWSRFEAFAKRRLDMPSSSSKACGKNHPSDG